MTLTQRRYANLSEVVIGIIYDIVVLLMERVQFLSSEFTGDVGVVLVTALITLVLNTSCQMLRTVVDTPRFVYMCVCEGGGVGTKKRRKT